MIEVGHRDERDQRGAELAQEHEDDQHHQPDRDEQRPLDVRDRGADGLSLIEPDGHDDGGIDARVQLRQRRLDRIDGGDDVRAGLAEMMSSAAACRWPARATAPSAPSPARSRRRRAAPAGRCGRRRSAAVVRRLHELIVGGDRASVRRHSRSCPWPRWRFARRWPRAHSPAASRSRSAASGLTSMRTAGAELPPTTTCPTPGDLREPLLQDGRCRIVERGRRQLVRGQRDDHDRRVRRVHLAVGRIARQVGGQDSCAPR